MTTDLGPALTRAAAGRVGADLARLQRYAAHETPTGDAAALDALATALAADVAPLGARTRRVPLPHGDALVLDLPGRGEPAGRRPALLLAHHDTVHPVGSLAGGMRLRRDGDVLHGPGVYDMKGGLVVALAALELLDGLRVAHRPVRLVLTPDEEVGSPSSAATVLTAADGVAYALGLEPPHPGGALKTSRLGSTRWRLGVTGRAAHAALDPAAGVNAIDELVDQLLAVRSLSARYPHVLVNVGTVRGGGRTNVVPESAAAEVGFRFVDGGTERTVLDELAALRPVRPGARLTPQVLSRRPAWGPSPATDELLAAVARAGALVGQDVTGAPASGAADTNLTGGAGVPSLDGFGPLGAGAHAVDERVDLRSLPERAALLAAVLHAV